MHMIMILKENFAIFPIYSDCLVTFSFFFFLVTFEKYGYMIGKILFQVCIVIFSKYQR